MNDVRASDRSLCNPFVVRHDDDIAGVLSCFDRLLFKGYLMPIGFPEGMMSFLGRHGVLLKDFKRFATGHSDEVKRHAQAMAAEAARPYVALKSRQQSKNKDERARRIAEQDQIAEGLICVMSSVEQCQSFKLEYGDKRPRLVSASPRCLCLYFYFMDATFGLIHVRIQTWFPFVVQIYMNGHDWLARQMTKAGLGYEQVDNTFVSIEDFAAAQRLSDQLAKVKWVSQLDRLASEVNPLMKGLLKGLRYYWVADQAEYATDIVFRSAAGLKDLYERLLHHGVASLGPEDVMTFLGRKLHGNFEGDLRTTLKTRQPGARLKQWAKGNWLKMYNKHGLVLRIETVINRPSEFRVRRMGKRNGELQMGWFPMAKRVTNLPRYAEVCWASNHRYMEALSAVDNPAEAHALLDKLCNPVTRDGKRYRGLNPLRREELNMFAVALRGENAMLGFRNDHLRRGLGLPRPPDPAGRKRVASRVGRLLRLLRAHGLLKRIPHTRAYRATVKGLTLMTAVLSLHRFDLVAEVNARM